MEEVNIPSSASFSSHLLRLSRVEWHVPVAQGQLHIRLLDAFAESELDDVHVQRAQGYISGSFISFDKSIEAPIVWDERVMPIAISALQLREQTEYLVEVEWEGGGHTPDWECFPNLQPPVMRVEPTRASTSSFRGRLNFRDYVGATLLVIRVEDREVFSVELEVRSKKIGYLDDYVALLDSLAERSVGLILRMGSPVFAEFSPQIHQPSAMGFEQFLVLRHIVCSETLREAIVYIREHPHTELKRSPSIATLGRDVWTSGRALSQGLRMTGPRVAWAGTPEYPIEPIVLPRSFVQNQRKLTMDTAENRWVVHFFLRVQELLNQLRYRFAQNRTEKGWSFLREAQKLESEWMQQLDALPFAQICTQQSEAVSSLSRVRSSLQYLPGYQTVCLFEEQLEQGLALLWEDGASSLAGPLRDVAQMYELWCFFELWDVLSQVAESTDASPWILRREQKQWYVRLSRGEQAGCSFSFKGAQIMLYYQRRFGQGRETQHSYSIALTPDYTLSIELPGHAPMYICFDAKYRPEGTLEKMHAYRDALRGAVGCYVLYPGSQTEPTLFHHRPDMPLPGVGAFPLRPCSETHVWLRSFLRFALEQIVETGDSLLG